MLAAPLTQLGEYITKAKERNFPDRVGGFRMPYSVNPPDSLSYSMPSQTP
jgi:hypothetical protein